MGLLPAAGCGKHLDGYRMSVQATNGRTIRSIFGEITSFQVPNKLAQTQVHTLITAGSLEVSPIVEGVKHLANLIPNAEGRLARNMHHGWNAEAPDEFSQMVRAWITHQPLPTLLYTPNNDEPEKQPATFHI
jgi:pimeloyl-ACP methyl ester carboxylesterase